MERWIRGCGQRLVDEVVVGGLEGVDGWWIDRWMVNHHRS